MMARCKLYGTNARDALAEEVTARMLADRRDRDTDPDTWEDAGPDGHTALRPFAEAKITTLHHG